MEKRVLQVVTILNRGGEETMIMNYYRNIVKAGIQFDFLVHRVEIGDYEEEITKMGGAYFPCLPYSSVELWEIPQVVDFFF